MIFGNDLFFSEETEEVNSDVGVEDLDELLPVDPNTTEGIDRIADKVEDAMQRQALEACAYFDGGEEALREFYESDEVQAYMEAFPSASAMKKKTFVRLSRKDDLKRRASVAALSIAKEKKDPLFDKWVKHRVKERSYREMIYKKYKNLALKAAKKSQKKHIKEKKSFPLPSFSK